MSPGIYTAEELLSRPIEHTVELLTCTELGRVLAVSRTVAWDIKRGERGLESSEERLLREWLRAQAAIAAGERTEVCA